jgi:transcriptional regulator with XRE-family HTH domain
MTQQQAAEAVEMSASAYSRLETGDAAVGVGRFWDLANLYGMKASALLRACEQTCARAKVITVAHVGEYPP